MANRIALLRGINLGSTNRVSMPELRALLERAGHEDVQTLVQSGNVVFTSRARPASLEQQLAQAIEKELGVAAKVVAAAIDANPFPVPDDPKNLHVTFLDGEPDAAALEGIDDEGPDKVAVQGREIYILYEDGMGRSELAKRLGKAKLGVTATDRNWNTVTKLLEMADA